MLGTFLNSVLPVFVVLLAGFGAQRGKIINHTEAGTLNRLVYYFLLPALLFRLVSEAPFEKFDYRFVLGYSVAELIAYACASGLAYFVFKRDKKESILLGMAVAFANHTFLILPIAEYLYGQDAVLPVISVIVIDNLLVFGSTVLILDLLSNGDAGNPLINLGKSILKNPNMMALILGVLVHFVPVPVDNGIGFYARLMGGAASPVSLFALGLVLGNLRLGGDVALLCVVSALKLLVVPFLAALLFFQVFELPHYLSAPGMLVASGPTGVIAFVLAMQYKIRVDLVSQLILVTTFLAVITVTIAASL